MKRIRGCHAAEVADDALEDGALLLLAVRAGLQEQQPQPWTDSEEQPDLGEAAAAAVAVAESSKGRHGAKASKTSYGTRSYVWRGPHRGALALQKQQQQQQAESGSLPLQQGGSTAVKQQQQHCCPSVSEGTSSRRSSVSGAAPSEDDEVAQQQQVSPRQRDKEWAALTTWLRMNLHHPRTVKKLILFVGQQNEATGSWSFGLNPGLAWSDVSLETRLRLQTLPVEAEQAFSHKYPQRPRHEWGDKLQKYRPPGSSSTVGVSLRDMVTSLCRIYYQHESSDSIAAALGLIIAPIHSTAPQQQQQQQQQHTLAVPVQHPVLPAATGADAAAAAAPAANPQMPHSAELQVQQKHLAVHPGLQLTSNPAALLQPTPAAAAAQGIAAGVVAVGVPVAGGVLLPSAKFVLAAGDSFMVQQQQHLIPAASQLHLRPGVVAAPSARPVTAAAAAAAGDGADSCAEAVTPVTPVSAPWTHCMAC